MASALTLLTDIRTYTPAYNRMELLVNEADAPTKALSQYRYIFDVYIEGITSPTFKRFYADLDPVLGYGYVDISRYVQGAVRNTMSQYNSVVPFSLGANATVGQSIVKVTVKYGYQYNNAGTFTTVADVITGSDKYVWNGAFDNQFFYNKFVGSNDFASEYLLNTTNGSAGQFITDMKTNKVSINNLGWHHILTDAPTDIDRLVVVTYDSSGSVIQTAIKAINVSQAVTTSRMYKVATGPESLNNMTGAFVSGAQPIVTSDVARYEVYLTTSAGTVVSETLDFEVYSPCRYEQRRVHFLNRFGSFDSFNFDLRSQKRTDIEKKSFKYNPYPIGTSGINRSFTEQNQVVHHVKRQGYIRLTSEYLTTEQNTWLEQLMYSPEIYIEEVDGNGDVNLTAVEMVVQNSWLEKESSIDKLFTVEVELKYSQQNYSQGR